MQSGNLPNTQTTKILAYHQSYKPIYNASYEFGFIFIDSEEEEEDQELYDQ
jgi:hypothetical protein